MADYSSRDTGNLNAFLQGIGVEFSIYTYSMLNAGVDKDSIRNLSEDQLMNECGISNSIHRLRILDSIKSMCVTHYVPVSCFLTYAMHIQQFYQKETGLNLVYLISDLENGLSNSCEENLDKSLDVFVSYRRSNGSQLAR
jgi:hypothetical protein